MLGSLLFSDVAPRNVIAQGEEEPKERVKTVEVEYTLYTWQIVSKITKQPICQVAITYEGYPYMEDILPECGAKINQLGANVYLSKDGLLKNVTWVLLSTEKKVRTEKINLLPLVADIYAPSEPTEQAYVIIKAIEPLADQTITGIYGFVNFRPFECIGASSCLLYLQSDSEITFWATSSFGDETEHYNATVRVIYRPPNYETKITSKSHYDANGVKFVSLYWSNVATGDIPRWMYVPRTVEGLATYNELQVLAGELINRGIVDVSGCPGGAMLDDRTPNKCGLQAAKPYTDAWQNQFDELIWNASEETGVPVILHKSMIEQESQFWPQSAYRVYGEYGFGQLNILGADVVLRWDADYSARLCANLQIDCEVFYAHMTPFMQEVLRGGVISAVNADCETCEYGINLDKAKSSILIFGKLLRANALQTSYIISKLKSKVDYEDLWKFTMVSYHSGYGNLDAALRKTLSLRKKLTWENVSKYISDPSAAKYVNDIWDKIAAFGSQPPAPTPTAAEPTPVEAFLPTLTPIPQVSPLIEGRILVILYVDLNQNSIRDPGENAEDVEVVVTIEGRPSISQSVSDGETLFTIPDLEPGTKLTISVPILYQSTDLFLPESGGATITFRLVNPSIPILLP